jgi:hypothetical protein
MRDKTNIAIFTLLLLLLLPVSEAYPQSADAVATLASAEAVLLNTDRSIYLPGDEMLLYATIVEADNYKTSNLSRILSIEILNSSGTPIFQEKTEATAGAVTRRVKLPGELPSGWYEIRAYTNWMRNRGTGSFSAVNVRVINPSALENVIITNQPDSLIIRAIPAGAGDLIGGIKNQCAVRVTDTYGNPVSFSGALKSSAGDTVARFTAGSTGWALVEFIPSSGLTYRFVPLNGSKPAIVTEMAAAMSAGKTLSLSFTRDSVIVLLRQTATSNSGEINLLVHSLSSLYWTDSHADNSTALRFSVPLNRLPEPAIMQFTLFNGQDEIIAQRLFQSGEIQAMGGNASVSMADAITGSGMTATFETDNRGTDGNYSLIIRKSEPVERSTLYLQGIAGWPARYDIPLAEAGREAWILANTYDPSVAVSFLAVREGEPASGVISHSLNPATREGAFRFMPETRGVTISGEVTIRGSTLPVVDQIMTLTLFSDNFLYTAATLKSGRFHFSLPGRRGKDDLILSYAGSPGKDWSLTLFPEFDNRPSSTLPVRVSLTSEELNYVREMALNRQLESVYNQSALPAAADTAELPVIRSRFLDYPDYLIAVEEFIRLPNMREVIFEVVPFVSARRENNRWVIKVSGEQAFPDIFQSLVLLDGIPLIEFDEFLELPPERIRRIEVINKLYIHGNVIFAGVVNFISANNDLAGLDLPPQSLIISMKMPGLSEPIDKIQHPDREEGTPNMESLLIIDPFMPGGRGSVRFTTSDNQGEYIFLVTGFTKEGRWVNFSQRFKVKSGYGNR